ncbi:MAG TPA: hypothetical protein PLW27_07620 [Kiritimatiellia bacterium]|nr:hypothetical protein [Kiritimatiellia bacterium]
MTTTTASTALSLILLWKASMSVGEVKPMIDHTHDRVQTTLNPGFKRIGTIKPRTAR